MSTNSLNVFGRIVLSVSVSDNLSINVSFDTSTISQNKSNPVLSSIIFFSLPPSIFYS